MQKIARVFRSHAEAEKSDREFYRSLTPAQRLDILLTLMARGNTTKSDETGPGLKRVYRVLNARNVRYLVVGRNKTAVGRKQDLADLDHL